MGRFTGKSDFDDWCTMHYTPERICEIASVFKDSAKLDIRNPVDLIPYYTHLIAGAGSSKDSQTIHLSSESYIDWEEKESLITYLKVLLPKLRKLKKLKKDFTIENLAEVGFETIFWYKDWLQPILNIITKNPEVIKYHYPSTTKSYIFDNFIRDFIIPNYFPGIHTARYNQQRKDFLMFCNEAGYKLVLGKKILDGPLYSPIISDMCFKVFEYEEMLKNEENSGC